MIENLAESYESAAEKYNQVFIQIGTKPSYLFDMYDAPNLWMAITNLASVSENTSTTLASRHLHKKNASCNFS